MSELLPLNVYPFILVSSGDDSDEIPGLFFQQTWGKCFKNVYYYLIMLCMISDIVKLE